MKDYRIKFWLTVVCLVSFSTFTLSTSAAPVRFNEVVQVVSIKSGKTGAGSYSQLRLKNEVAVFDNTNDDNESSTQDDDRVIKETKVEIVEEPCDCVDSTVIKKAGFPKWALLGLAAIPVAFLIVRDKDKTPTPTTTSTPTSTPTLTPTPTPPTTPTPTITPTPTPPEPIPEPMTILLFGTGLAGIGLAARRKFGKKNDKKSEK